MQSSWHFLTNHAHVLICIAADPDTTVRSMAQSIGITERAVIRIIGELDASGFLERTREGRNNHYTIHADQHLRHPVESHRTVGDLIDMVLEGSNR